jgi:hypothetical protein
MKLTVIAVMLLTMTVARADDWLETWRKSTEETPTEQRERIARDANDDRDKILRELDDIEDLLILKELMR